jgi:hypothetical protein
MPAPSLTSILPVPGKVLSLDERLPATIGSAPGSTILLPPAEAMAEHQATLERRDGVWWIRPEGGRVRLNDVVITADVRLFDRDRITFSDRHSFEFATGEPRTRRMSSPGEMIARPRRRASGALPRGGGGFSWPAFGTALIALVLVGGAAVVAWNALRAPRTVAALDDRQAAELDTLLITSYDHVERGGTLLELGLGDGAAQEFAQAINTLELSDLRNNPQVRPRIEALSASVASIYRERSLAVPDNYANATSPLTPEQLKTASLTVEDFAAKFGLMAATFKATFGHDIVVSGRDHAEHVILYGKGGAMDLSIKEMTHGEVGWIINKSHALHIRVKDFSQDTVLRRQVASAVKKGLLFEAGTGLHIHIDRFANKRDRWTTLGPFRSGKRSAEFGERGALAGIIVARRHDGG